MSAFLKSLYILLLLKLNRNRQELPETYIPVYDVIGQLRPIAKFSIAVKHMLCPECNRQLLPILIRPGKNMAGVELDYCANCGGVWSDRGETNFLNSEDLAPLYEALPANAETQNNITPPVCPRDRADLNYLRGENVPNYLSLLSCSRCGGIWFPKKQIIEFKKAQRTKVEYFKAWQLPLTSIYAVLLPLLLVFLLGAGALMTFYSGKQGTDLRIKASDKIKQPLVIQPEPGTAVISITTDGEILGKIKYWLKSDAVDEEPLIQTAANQYGVTLRGLVPNRIYSYQIELETPNYTSPIYSFSTKLKQP